MHYRSAGRLRCSRGRPDRKELAGAAGPNYNRAVNLFCRRRLLILLPGLLFLAWSRIGAEPRSWLARGTARVAVPAGYVPGQAREVTFATEEYNLKLYSSRFAQGELVYVELTAVGDSSIEESQLFLDALPVPLEPSSFGMRGLFALAPTLPAGTHNMILVRGDSRQTHELSVQATDFPVYRSQLDLGSFSDQTRTYTPEQLAFIRTCSAHKAAAFGRRTALALVGRFSHPRDEHRVTSPFYSTRFVERYRVRNGVRQALEPTRNVHQGLDLRGLTGAPIFALADGTIALAENMFFEGNLTVIDHGQGIFSVYMHQSELLVQPGEHVEAGQLIGRTGATGMVTGPHLHISVYVRGISADPLSMLVLPVRD
ncbi:MAG: M23 family metallopeptidase [Spirochaetales bacterium]|nr:M23 family metallopeptidase [Leptospiraceae bacterium]MCP5482515.1 M23 family metallopeptidase [Spirochaetales bacterium]